MTDPARAHASVWSALNASATSLQLLAGGGRVGKKKKKKAMNKVSIRWVQRVKGTTVHMESAALKTWPSIGLAHPRLGGTAGIKPDEVRLPDCSPIKQGTDVTQPQQSASRLLDRQPGRVTDTLLDFTASLRRRAGRKRKKKKRNSPRRSDFT